VSPEVASRNEAILARVEELGGGYVWEPECFAVTLLDVPINDVEAEKLGALTGVGQIAINAAALRFSTLRLLVAIPGLRSLVIAAPAVTPAELASLREVGPEIVVT